MIDCWALKYWRAVIEKKKKSLEGSGQSEKNKYKNLYKH